MNSSSTLEPNTSSQSDLSNQSSILSVITNKLGHDLDEIKLRSLENLYSKLENNLISEDDVILNRDLLVRLLDILDEPSLSKHHEKSIKILNKLIRWPSTSKTLLLLNALEILENFNQQLKDSSLRSNVETILEHLNIQLNEWNKSNDRPINLTESHSLNVVDHLAKLSIKRLTKINNSGSDCNDQILSVDHTKFDQLDLNSLNSTDSNMTNIIKASNNQQSQSGKEKSMENTIASEISKATLQLQSSMASSKLTKTFQMFHQDENHHQTIYSWLPLTQADKNFLEITENTLKTKDIEKIKSYCTFLQTNVFNDFPAEVFLQRSTILKILTDLTISSYTRWQEYIQISQKSYEENDENDDYLSEESSLLKCLINCLGYYVTKLKKRIKYIKDPSTLCCKGKFVNLSITSEELKFFSF